MKHFFLLLTALIATTALWAGSVITYKEYSKLSETTNPDDSGLHTNAFNVSVASHTFSKNTGKITFTGTLTDIGGWAFSHCSSLTSITIPNTVTSIGDYAFQSCASLTTITIPNSVTCIRERAFSDCTSLKSISIPNSVTSLGKNAFYGCASLSSITCYATTPPACAARCFSYVNTSIPIYVPAGSVSAYMSANGWKDFTNFQAIP